MGYTKNCEIWHGASLGILIIIQEKIIWRTMWGPCFGHKRAIFWPFRGKGATVINVTLPQCIINNLHLSKKTMNICENNRNWKGKKHHKDKLYILWCKKVCIHSTSHLKRNIIQDYVSNMYFFCRYMRRDDVYFEWKHECQELRIKLHNTLIDLELIKWHPRTRTYEFNLTLKQHL